MKKLKIGYAICGSFCTFAESIKCMDRLVDDGMEVFPIMSENAYSINTRFGAATEHISKIKSICGRDIIHTIADAEPVGPKRLFDIMLIAPCTGNTLAKLALGITDTSVTMAAKSHLRNSSPLLLAIATNDALSASAKNIGLLMNRKNIYFVPFGQDAPDTKPTSCIADFFLVPQSIEAALSGRQIQPMII